MTSPSFLSSVAVRCKPPSAFATPGTARTVSSTEAGTGSRTAEMSSTVSTERTSRSTLAVSSVNRLSNVALRLSARMNDPETNATEATIAIPIAIARPIRARSERRASLGMTLIRLATDLLHAVDDLVDGRLRHVVHDLAVGEEHDAVGVGGSVGVVRHHHDRLAEIVDRVAHELQDVGAR